MTNHKVIILGSGPAGLTAAIYTARAGLTPLLIAGPLPGGQLTTTTEVENFPGFEEGIQGPELMQVMEKQARRFGAEFKSDLVISADLSKRPFTLKTQKEEFQTESLIIATGANPRYLGIAGEKELLGFGVSTCATCDGAFFRNQKIAVIGGGDSACEEALFLTRFGSEVFLIHRREELRASKIMQERVFKHEKIKPIWNSIPTEVIGDRQTGIKELRLKNIKDQTISALDCQAVFIAIGHTPNSQLFSDQLNFDAENYILTLPDSTKTNIAGVFACGDVQDRIFRQAITAAGSGCMAAIEAERWLEASA